MNAPEPPKAPDPVATANAQTASNKETAIANANLNRFDQNGPTGSVKYTIVGTNPDGTPKYQQDTTLNPAYQKMQDNYTTIAGQLGDFGISQGNKVAGILSNPLDLNTATENNIVALQQKRLDPQWAQQEESLRTQLTNQGIRPGTDAYDREMQKFSDRRSNAYDSMYLNARAQGANEALAQRSVPLNELMTVMGGNQVQNPTFTPTAGVSQANTDVAGITQAGFQNQMGLYNSALNQNNAMMGGIFGLGSAAAMAWSDRRLKREIEPLGIGAGGLTVYGFKYLWSDEPQVGYMAHEVLDVFPAAVFQIGDYLAVDYGRVG